MLIQVYHLSVKLIGSMSQIISADLTDRQITTSPACINSFKYFLNSEYRYCSISVELRRWSGDGALFTRLDKYRVFFHTSNC